MIETKVIFAIVGGVWLLLSAIMMSIRKKRNSKLEAYLTANADKALLQLCGKKFWIDGRDLALFETVSAKKLQEIVALPEGSHRIAGIYESPEVCATASISVSGESSTMMSTIFLAQIPGIAVLPTWLMRNGT